MNNQNMDQQQTPQQAAPQQMPQQQYVQAVQKKAFAINNDMMGIISCTSGMISFGLGILSAIMSNSVYGIATASYVGSKYFTGVYGFSPVVGFILNIFALVLGIFAVLLALKAGNDRIRSGMPRGTIATLGLVFGIAGAFICFIALFFTSCSMCSNCSMIPKN